MLPGPRETGGWLDPYVGCRATLVRTHLWKPEIWVQWVAALQTPFIKQSHMGCSGPHTLRMEFVCLVIEESIPVCYAHAKLRATVPKARLVSNSTAEWVLHELHMHQQPESKGVPREQG